MTHSTPDIFTEWLTALEARHLADLRVPEVTRALRALSSAYVERRHKVATGATLDSAGKRAAFALFYAPLHFLAAQQVVRTLHAAAPPPATIVDIGCGTGAAGAAWAIEAGSSPVLSGIAAIAAYVLNELPDTPRQQLEASLLVAAAAGARVLVIEPIARAVTPWWD